MNAVVRVKQYSNLLSEQYQPELSPNIRTSWPENGAVEFDNVQLQYSPLDPLVLNGITFKIGKSETVGIVGKTGAGKSTLISTLFRLCELTGGCIKVDGKDISEIPLEILRSRLALIPQDPILFTGTIRQNLDPFEEFSDQQIWKALSSCSLLDVVEQLESTLLYKVSENGCNFSLGQRQLFCLARAILRKDSTIQKNRAFILVMDEVTSNVDLETDSILQRTIRKEFSGTTILIIAHRLHTIIDCDSVLVLDQGKVAEFDHPMKLLEKNGLFSSMAHDTNNFDYLFEKAKESWNLKIA